MQATKKTNKTFSLDSSVLDEVKRTKGKMSESERVNTLLRSALDIEKRAALREEAARFYASAPDDRAERQGYLSATTESLSRD